MSTPLLSVKGQAVPLVGRGFCSDVCEMPGYSLLFATGSGIRHWGDLVRVGVRTATTRPLRRKSISILLLYSIQKYKIFKLGSEGIRSEIQEVDSQLFATPEEKSGL